MKNPKNTNELSEDSGHGFERLLEQVNLMVAQSGSHTGFDSRRWLNEWLELPLAALDGAKPADYMATKAGLQLVLRLLTQMQSGAYG
ncbi:MAG: MbcA/ParS/Xre antitoxin family protein [Burkholderiaceae bacterium]|nr:MbcA/ParS/Xre antitoxin family protein [Burkholderiaceae bacterium]